MYVRSVTLGEISHFKDNGWVYLPGLVDTAMISPKYQQAASPQMHNDQVGTYGSRSDRGIFSFFDRSHESAFKDSVVLSPMMGSNIARLLNVPTIRVLSQRFLLKGPQSDGLQDRTLYHQDFPGHPVDRSNFLTIWIALHDMPPEAGTMRFFNRSHKRGVFGQVFADGIDLRDRCPELVDEDLSPPISMRAGDATAHHCLTVHGAPANLTKAPRWSYITIYMDAQSRYTCVPAPMPEGAKFEPYDLFDHPGYPLVPTT
jgi:hypothetical protein